MSKVYEVIHTSPELKTVYDFIVAPHSAAENYASSPESFLEVKNVKGQTNREVIEATYTSKAEKDKYKGKGTRELFLKVGTRLAVEVGKLNKGELLTEGFEIVSYDIPAFKARALAELEAKETYKVQDYARPIKGQLKKGGAKITYPDVTVWVWCRSLASAANNFEGEIFNVTPFVEKVTSDVGKNGGNFSITLPPLVCVMNDKGQWVVKKSDIQFYQGRNLNIQKSDYVAQGYIHQEQDGEMVRSSFLFHNIISAQDVVWIRYETLQVEQEDRIKDAEQLYVSKYSLPNRIYDMIGLVDVDDISVMASSVDVTIQISGRDLMKLLIEDGTYFYNLELAQGMLGGPGSAADKDGLSGRLVADKALMYLGLYFNNSIENVVKFVVNQLSSIKVVPDDLFVAYGDRRNSRYIEDNKDDAKRKVNDQREEYRKQAIQGLTNIRKSNGLTLTSPIDEKRKVNEIYEELTRLLKTIRDNGTRRVEGGKTLGWKVFTYHNKRGVQEQLEQDTYPNYFATDLFNLRATRTVPEIYPVVDAIDAILDIDQGKSKFEPGYEKKPAPGIWQIVKLVLDEGVTSRRPIDSSISSANGSLLNFFRKVCQEPFVEFYGDTYGDMYHLIIRKPPTDKQGILSMLRGQVVTEDVTGERVTPTVIDIEPEDVLFEQLSFDDTEAYSWYHLTPYANFQGSEQFSLAYLPAIFLEEYADIWGSRPMQVEHNYLPALTVDAPKEDLDKVQKQTVEDFRYVIQSSAYLPFTRKGVIKTNGDRRYKVGNLIRYKDTGEIFMIDHVKQDFTISEQSIDRTSTIQVSRGMIEQLIYGVPAKTTNSDIVNGYISYFNIVNTNPLYSYSDNTTYTEEQVKVGQKEVVKANADSGKPKISLADLYEGNSITEKDNVNMWVLDNFPPQSKKRFTQLINSINRMGYRVAIKDADAGVRTLAVQAALHAANSKNAKPGHSRHETGRALDLNIISKANGIQYRKESSKQSWLETGVPEQAKALGFAWGGDFDNYHDPVHFEITEDGSGNTVSYEDVYETRRKAVHEKSLDVGKIFSNFKVNKYVFDFFLRREQFNPIYRNVVDRGIYDDSGNKGLEEVVIKTVKK